MYEKGAYGGRVPPGTEAPPYGGSARPVFRIEFFLKKKRNACGTAGIAEFGAGLWWGAGRAEGKNALYSFLIHVSTNCERSVHAVHKVNS